MVIEKLIERLQPFLKKSRDPFEKEGFLPWIKALVSPRPLQRMNNFK